MRARVFVFLLALLVLLACVAAVSSLDCGGNQGCAASKLALAYLLLALGVALAGSVGWRSGTPATLAFRVPLRAWPPLRASRQVAVRAPPLL